MPPASGPFNPLRATAKHFRAALGAGILVMLPIGITILIFRFFFDLLDPIFQPVLNRVPWLDQACDSFSPAGTTCPGLGLVMLLLITYLVGLITAHVVGRRVVQLGHTVMEAIPVVKSVYSTARSALTCSLPPRTSPTAG